MNTKNIEAFAFIIGVVLSALAITPLTGDLLGPFGIVLTAVVSSLMVVHIFKTNTVPQDQEIVKNFVRQVVLSIIFTFITLFVVFLFYACVINNPHIAWGKFFHPWF